MTPATSFSTAENASPFLRIVTAISLAVLLPVGLTIMLVWSTVVTVKDVKAADDDARAQVMEQASQKGAEVFVLNRVRANTPFVEVQVALPRGEVVPGWVYSNEDNVVLTIKHPTTGEEVAVRSISDKDLRAR